MAKTIGCRTQFDLNHPLWPPSESGQFVWRSSSSVVGLFGGILLREGGIERSAVGLSLTCTTRCSCLLRRDTFRSSHGCWVLSILGRAYTNIYPDF